MRIAALAAALALACVSVPADARPRQIVAHPDCNIVFPCEGVTRSARGERIAKAVGFGVAQNVYHLRGEVIGGRPAGCPHRYCGCGASLHLFGKIIPALNLAANWLRFPRATPATNMVAARRGHVFVLKQHISGSVWLVHDSNSGGGKTRLHARSITGFVIVDPSEAG